MRNFPVSLRRILALVVLGLTATWGMRQGFAGPRASGRPEGATSAVTAHVVSPELRGAADALESTAQEGRETWKVKVEGLPFDPVPRDGEHNTKCPAVVYELVGRDGRSVREFGFVEESELELPVRSWIAGGEFDVAEVRAVGGSANGERWRPVEGFDSVLVRGEGERVLRFELAPKTHLIVKDAETGEPFEQVEIRFSRSDDPGSRYRWNSTRLGDGALGIWQACERQPIELEPLVPSTRGLSGRVELRVRAAGRAERQIAVKLGSGGTHEVLLERSGSARLTWHVPMELEELGYRSEVPLALGLEFASSGATAPATAADFELLPFQHVDSGSPVFGKIEQGRIRWMDLTGLVPGTYVAQFELPRQVLLRTTPLARATFTVGQGGFVDVELETVLEPEARPSRLAFELDIPAELGAAPKCSLQLRRYDGSTAPASFGAPDSYLSSYSGPYGVTELDYNRESRRSSSVLISKGECELAISGDFEYCVRLQVGAGVEERRRISIPSPTRMRVRLVADRVSGEELPPVLRWLARFETGYSRSFLTFGTAGQPGVFELAPLSDRVELDCPLRFAFEGTASRTLQLEGAGEHEVRIVPLPLLRIRLSLEGRPHSVPPEFEFKVVRPDADEEPLFPALDRQGSSQLRARHEGGEYEQRVWFAAPGEHELWFAKLDGYRPFPRQKVTLAARGDSVLELPLVPER